MEKTISLNLTVTEDVIDALNSMLTKDDKELYKDFRGDFDELDDDYDGLDDDFDEEDEFDPVIDPDSYAFLSPSDVDDIRTYADYLKAVIRNIYETNSQVRNVLRRHRSWTEKSADVLKLLSLEEAIMESAEACVFNIVDKCKPLREEIGNRKK